MLCVQSTEMKSALFLVTAFAVASVSNAQNQPLCPTLFGDYPAGNGCVTFVRCFRGHAYAMRCPANTGFDPASRRCVNQQQFVCANNNQVAGPLIGGQGQRGAAAIGQVQQPTINQVQVAGFQPGLFPDNGALFGLPNLPLLNFNARADANTGGNGLNGDAAAMEAGEGASGNNNAGAEVGNPALTGNQNQVQPAGNQALLPAPGFNFINPGFFPPQQPVFQPNANPAPQPGPLQNDNQVPVPNGNQALVPNVNPAQPNANPIAPPNANPAVNPVFAGNPAFQPAAGNLPGKPASQPVFIFPQAGGNQWGLPVQPQNAAGNPAFPQRGGLGGGGFLNYPQGQGQMRGGQGQPVRVQGQVQAGDRPVDAVVTNNNAEVRDQNGQNPNAGNPARAAAPIWGQNQGQGQAGWPRLVPVFVANQHQVAKINQRQSVDAVPGK